MKRVLVYPGGTEVGLEIQRSLRHSRHYQPVGASSVPDHAEFAYNEVVSDAPWVLDHSLPTALATIVDRLNIDIIYPAHDDSAVAVTAAAESGALPVQVAGPPHAACLTARSKTRTYAALKGAVDTARPASRESELPVFVKPDEGQGSRGSFLVHDHETLERALGDSSLVVQEYLPGIEITVDCFTDRTGRLRYARARSRDRVIGGIAARCHWISEDFTPTATRISQILGMRGAWFVQAIQRASGEFVVTEVGARVAGSMAFSRASGVNLPLLTLFDLDGHDVEIPQRPVNVEMDRSLAPRFRVIEPYTDVFIDLDDCIVFDGLVDPLAIAFIFQCRNARIPLHLVTRRAGDMGAYLAGLGLSDLFSSVTQLVTAEPKSGAISGQSPIFIDDSYAERQEVESRLAVPVFSPQQFDVLINWRP